MNLAITSTDSQIEASFDPRFGRCAYFILVDTTTEEWEAIANQAASARGGAGTQAAQFIASRGVDAVVSGKFGPKAALALDVAGIKMYEATKGTVQLLLKSFQSDGLKPASFSLSRRMSKARGHYRRGRR